MRNHGEQRRALRYPLELPIEVEGAMGRTRDFSSSGVFFETGRTLAPGAPIEFSLVLGRVSPGLPLRLDCEAAPFGPSRAPVSGASRSLSPAAGRRSGARASRSDQRRA